jgi:hypothetical protein
MYRHIAFIYAWVPEPLIYAAAALGCLTGLVLLVLAALADRERDFGIFLLPWLPRFLRIGGGTVGVLGIAAAFVLSYPLLKRDIAEALTPPPQPRERAAGVCLEERAYFGVLAEDRPLAELGSLGPLPAAIAPGGAITLALELAGNRDIARLSCLRVHVCREESETICFPAARAAAPFGADAGAVTVSLAEDAAPGPYRLHMTVFEARQPSDLAPFENGTLPIAPGRRRYRFRHDFTVGVAE